MDLPESFVRADARRFWTQSTNPRLHGPSHWRRDTGLGDERWRKIGRRHVNLFQRFAAFVGMNDTPERIVEWGCGGGANAVMFAPLCKTFLGVDVSRDSLEECAKQVDREGFNGRFEPRLADLDAPEATARDIPPCDFFLCTYVFELIPGRDYGARLVRIARDVLKPGGSALIQIKYETKDWRSRPRRFAYARNLANTTTFTLEGFWALCEECGFAPAAVVITPRDELVDDERYAYFFLTKARQAGRPAQEYCPL